MNYLIWICVCLIICLLLFREGALELEAVGDKFAQAQLIRLTQLLKALKVVVFNGFSAAEALVAAFRFGLLGGSAVTMDDDGISIGTAKSLVNSAGGFGGVVITVRFGFVAFVLEELELHLNVSRKPH